MVHDLGRSDHVLVAYLADPFRFIDDATQVIERLGERGLCAACLTATTGIVCVEEVVEKISRTLRLRDGMRRCGGCGKRKMVYRLM